MLGIQRLTLYHFSLKSPLGFGSSKCLNEHSEDAKIPNDTLQVLTKEGKHSMLGIQQFHFYHFSLKSPLGIVSSNSLDELSQDAKIPNDRF
jgi:hypothetical protein